MRLFLSNGKIYPQECVKQVTLLGSSSLRTSESNSNCWAILVAIKSF